MQDVGVREVKQNLKKTIELMIGDITKLKLDAIVNAANTSLLGGGGVDGAIHRAAGKELEFECRMLGGCKVGQAKITNGFNLPAQYIIHTVGPVWRGGNYKETGHLKLCYQNSLELAEENQVSEIAFPAISTGIYNFPADLAAKISMQVCSNFLQKTKIINKVIFCCFTKESARFYKDEINAQRSNKVEYIV